MRKKVTIIALVMVLLALSFGCAPAAKPAETSAPVLVITPISGKAAASIKLCGAGFVPGENIRVEVRMGGLDLALGRDATAEKWVANEAGAIGGVIRVPMSFAAQPGVYTVQAVGDKGSVACYPLEVLA